MRETHRQTDRETETDRQRQRDRDTQRDRDRERERELVTRTIVKHCALSHDVKDCAL